MYNLFLKNKQNKLILSVIEWDNVAIRVVVLAPSIKLLVLRLLKKINYNVELVEVRWWKQAKIKYNEDIDIKELEKVFDMVYELFVEK